MRSLTNLKHLRALMMIRSRRVIGFCLQVLEHRSMPRMENMIFLHLHMPWRGRKNFYLKLSCPAQLRRWHADLSRRAVERSSTSTLRTDIKILKAEHNPTVAHPSDGTMDIELSVQQHPSRQPPCPRAGRRILGNPGTSSRGQSTRCTPSLVKEEAVEASQVFGTAVVYTPRGRSGTVDEVGRDYKVQASRYPSITRSAREASEANDRTAKKSSEGMTTRLIRVDLRSEKTDADPLAHCDQRV